MAGKDMAEKALEAYNDVFADIVNNLLFHGREIVSEDDLEQGRERSVYFGEKQLREQERDTSKYWKKNNVRIAFIGFENETHPEDDMPFRIIGYDGAAYRDQIYYEAGDSGKRIKSMTRFPVVTLVLYFGYKKHWDKAKTLYDAVGDNVTEEIAPYFNDYKINLFEIAYLSDGQLRNFKSDFRYVADYFVQMRKKGTYVGSMDKIRHIREVLQLLAVLSQDYRFWDIAEKNKEGAVVESMSEALDIIEARGEARGEAKGKVITLITLVYKKIARGWTPEKIADMLEEDEDYIRDIYNIINEDLDNFDKNIVYNRLMNLVSA